MVGHVQILMGRLAAHINGVRHEMVESWVALLLTAGEFSIAIFLLVHDGHVLAIYLAVTYLFRETKGGREYHELVLKAIKRTKEGS